MTDSPQHPYGVMVQTPATGMGRFFNPTNVDRYRKLASNTVGIAERHQVLDVLAEEMETFRRESRRRRPDDASGTDSQ